MIKLEWFDMDIILHQKIALLSHEHRTVYKADPMLDHRKVSMYFNKSKSWRVCTVPTMELSFICISKCQKIDNTFVNNP
jgi:hypothetical protein